MDKLEIRLLGTLSVAARTTGEFALPRKNKAVLAALALAGATGLSREKLIELFWPDRSEKQAQASLRQTLAAIRKVLGPYRECLEAGPMQVSIDQRSIELDVQAFEGLAAARADEDRDQALTLYQGDLLAGTRLKEEGFEAWLRPLRERLRGKAVSLLAESLDGTRNAARCVDLATRLLELDPTNEAAHRALMRTYAAQGRDNAALKQFIACRDLLEQELGVGPEKQTIVLFGEIKGRRRGMGGNKQPNGGRTTAATPAAITEENPAPTAKPTITVMPFESFSDAPGQNHFAAAMTHDIIQALLRHRWLTVISTANMMDAGRFAMLANDRVIEANVDYLVTGSIQKSGDRLRISVQMLETESGEHIWSEHYDRNVGDIFLLQDEITSIIASHIDVEVGASERQRAVRVPTENMGAWDCYHLGMAHFYRLTGDDVLEAQRLFARSVELDPAFGASHAWGSYTEIFSTFYYDTEPTDELFARALAAAQRAVKIDDQNAIFHMLVARVYLAQREYAKCLAEMEIAMTLNPNASGIYCGMGDALNYEGQYERASGQFDKALQLGPRDPLRASYFGYGALNHLFAEKFEAAVEWSELAMHAPNCQYWPYAHRAAAFGHLGRHEEARAAVAELHNIQPNFSRSLAEHKLYFIKRPEQLQIYLEGLEKAGI